MYQSQCSFFFKSVIAAKETSEISAMPPKTVEPQPPEEGLVVLTVALAIMVEGLSEAVVSEAELPTMGTVVVTGSVVELDTGSLVAAVASVVATVVAGSCSTESVLVSPQTVQVKVLTPSDSCVGAVVTSPSFHACAS